LFVVKISTEKRPQSNQELKAWCVWWEYIIPKVLFKHQNRDMYLTTFSFVLYIFSIYSYFKNKHKNQMTKIHFSIFFCF